MKTKIIALLGAALLSACENPDSRDTTRSVESTNPAFGVMLLFEVDGVKVYRFRDDGYYRYFADRSGSISSVQTHKEGKRSVTTPMEIQTIEPRKPFYVPRTPASAPSTLPSNQNAR